MYSTVGKEVFSGCSEYQIGCFDTKIAFLFVQVSWNFNWRIAMNLKQKKNVLVYGNRLSFDGTNVYDKVSLQHK